MQNESAKAPLPPKWLSVEDLDDWMRGIEGILRQQRKTLDALNAKLDGIQRYLNSSQVLAALARGVQREEENHANGRREGAAINAQHEDRNG